MSTDTVGWLRQRMIEDMNARKLCAGTQRVLIPVQAAHHNEMMSPAVTE